ncbi:MAG: helix-turn-helix domain-containing protein [Bdellovibrionota bacterium]|nr:helix-turn-helix domain-containing protein [Bdellovibrionota bacterium]MEC8625144.1 helix-turn-helix domain-containing protein [Bdellovibrionota bacterium]
MPKKTIIAFGVEERIDHEEKFIQINLLAFDKLINDVINKKIRSQEAMLFIWMATYAWKTNKGSQRNPFTIPISQIAEMYGYHRSTIERWLKKLNERGYTKPIYRIKHGRIPRIEEFECHEKAKFKKLKYSGSWKSNHYQIKRKGFLVDLTHKKRLRKRT